MDSQSTSISSHLTHWAKSLPLSELRRLLERAEAAERELKQESEARPTVLWEPLPGPQTAALHTEADQLFYGGAAGGGKTDLLLGCSAIAHERSIIFRREFKQLEGLRERAEEIYTPWGKYRGGDRELWRLNYGGIKRRVEFGAVQRLGDEKKYQGRAHDLKAFDEIPHFAEQQYRFLIGWNRTTDPNERVRVIAAGNPPTDAEGDWVISYWAPWLDNQHPNPAKPGELRWFATIKGKDVEVEDSKPIIVEGEDDPVKPHSRTFIRAFAKDNPFYMKSGYLTVLQGLPEPLRSKMLLGDFGAGREDHEKQVIPTEWVIKAQGRWTEDPPGPIDSLGMDVARGGKDKTVLTPRHGWWFGRQHVRPGKSTPDGWEGLQFILEVIPTGARPTVNIDIVGVGSAVYDLAVGKVLAVPLDSRHATAERDKSGLLGFFNNRAKWWWRLREALDPLTGDDLAIPPDRELLADLTSARWKPTVRGIQIEEKDDIIERIGRSPDKGESLVYAHAIEEMPIRTVLI